MIIQKSNSHDDNDGDFVYSYLDKYYLLVSDCPQ